MAKVIIDFPLKFNFSTKTYVRISDVNYGGHVGNDVILSYMHEARVRFLKAHGYGELDLAGVGIIMNDVAVVYKGELFHGDKINIEVGLNDFSSVGFDMIYRITEISSGKEIALGKTGIVCFDYQKRKVSRIPEGVKDKLQS